jgi:hypothetical protein
MSPQSTCLKAGRFGISLYAMIAKHLLIIVFNSVILVHETKLVTIGIDVWPGIVIWILYICMS